MSTYIHILILEFCHDHVTVGPIAEWIMKNFECNLFALTALAPVSSRDYNIPLVVTIYYLEKLNENGENVFV